MGNLFISVEKWGLVCISSLWLEPSSNPFTVGSSYLEANRIGSFFFFCFVFPKEPSEVLRNAENSSSCLKRAYCPMQADSLTSILAQALLAGLRKFDLPSAFNKCPHLPFYPPLDSNKLQGPFRCVVLDKSFALTRLFWNKWR